MKNGKTYVFGFLGFCILLAIDQWTKWLACTHLKMKASIPVIKDVFELQYLENCGAAFGMLQGKRIFLLILTFVVFVLLIYVYGRIPEGKRFHALRVLDVLFAAGAVGNMLDRFFRQYVVDFFYFKLINFPVFNVADCYVVIGAIATVLLFIFYYKEEDFSREESVD